MTDKTLGKVALLVALIPYLVAERSVPVATAAAHFDVPESRIREAVSLIFMSGVPDGFGDFDRFDINVDAFFDDDIIELGFLPVLDGNTLRLAPREANAILAGLSLISSLQNVDPHVVDALRGKLRRAAVAARPNVAVDAPVVDPRFQALRDAIEHRVVVAFDYQKPGSVSEQRRVAPTSLELRDGEAYLVGFDLDRQAERRFRLDRAGDVRHVSDDYPHVALTSANAATPRVSSDDVLIVDATRAAAALLEDYVTESTASADGRVILTIPVWEAGSVMQHIAALGGDAVIVAPVSAREAMRRLSDAALSNYMSAA